MTDQSTMTAMPTTGLRTAMECVMALHAALAAAGMPRTSTFAGGEMLGWTEVRGSTGFSVRDLEDGTLYWHVVVSGMPLMRYHHYESHGDSLHEPIHPEAIHPRIDRVFTVFGLEVMSVSYCGHQTMWDDDVEYAVVTRRPDWLEARPQPTRRWR